MPDYDSRPGGCKKRVRLVDELPRVDSEKPGAWPAGFVPPPIVEKRAGTLIGGRPQTRPSFVCPGCERGCRSLWFGVPNAQEGPQKPQEGASENTDDTQDRNSPAEGAAGSLDGTTWACWRCLKLVRRSQQRDAPTRAVDRAKKLRERLGADPTLYTGDPAVPPELALCTDPECPLLEYDEAIEKLRRAEFESLIWKNGDLRDLRGY